MIPDRLPVPGTVIRYSYLWKEQADQEREEGEKDRPVALLLTAGTECIVLPITHSRPDDRTAAVPIPDAERARLGLDDEPCWIVLTELNAFVWPGPDLRPIPGKRPNTVISAGSPGALSRRCSAESKRVRAKFA